MTKRVRIENADNSHHELVVEVWIKGENGEADELINTRPLNTPTDQIEDFVYFGRYLVIREVIDGE